MSKSTLTKTEGANTRSSPLLGSEWRARSKAINAAIDAMPVWRRWGCLLFRWRKFRTAAAYNRVACHLWNEVGFKTDNDAELWDLLCNKSVDLWEEVYPQNNELRDAGRKEM